MNDDDDDDDDVDKWPFWCWLGMVWSLCFSIFRWLQLFPKIITWDMMDGGNMPRETHKNMPSPIYLKLYKVSPIGIYHCGHVVTNSQNLTKGPEISYFGDDSPYEKHLWCCEVAMVSMSKELRPEPRWTVQKAHMQQEVNDIDASGVHYFSSLGHSKSNAPKTGWVFVRWNHPFSDDVEPWPLIIQQTASQGAARRVDMLKGHQPRWISWEQHGQLGSLVGESSPFWMHQTKVGYFMGGC